MIASTRFRMCVVEVTALPPSIHIQAPRLAISSIAGSSVVSPGPQMNRGRSTMVVKPPAESFAWRTARSARALVLQ